MEAIAVSACSGNCSGLVHPTLSPACVNRHVNIEIHQRIVAESCVCVTIHCQICRAVKLAWVDNTAAAMIVSPTGIQCAPRRLSKAIDCGLCARPEVLPALCSRSRAVERVCRQVTERLPITHRRLICAAAQSLSECGG